MPDIDTSESCTNYGLQEPHFLGANSGGCLPCTEFNLAMQRERAKAITPNVELDSLTLDPNDPFDKVIIDMVNMNRKKRRDYAADSDPFSNFRDTARNMALEGFGPAEAAYALLLTKVSRLRSLRANGRMEDTANESVLDTYLDLSVYAVILLALVKEQSGPQQSER